VDAFYFVSKENKMSFASPIEKVVAFALPALFLTFSVLWAAQDADDIPITRHEVSKDVVLYQAGKTGAFANMTAVRTSAGTVVFDALVSPALAKRVRGMIEKDFRGKIACLINTHGAIDHTGGNPAFKDVPIYGHANIETEMNQMSQVMARWATNPPPAPTEETKKLLEEVKRNYRGDLREFDETDRMMRFLDPLHPLEMVVPTTLIGESYDLTVGDKTFHMFHNTPSYSESDIVTYIPEINMLIVGDIFNAGRIPFFSPQGTDLDSWTKLFAPYIADNSKIERFIGTHGTGHLTAAEIREQFQYLKKLSDEVKNLKASGKSAAEIQAILPLNQFPYLSKYNPYFYGTPQNIHASNIAMLWNRSK
jgi:glyoxylase-like metal-dependent hydrolase (beta-lactamase superfamily II)